MTGRRFSKTRSLGSVVAVPIDLSSTDMRAQSGVRTAMFDDTTITALAAQLASATRDAFEHIVWMGLPLTELPLWSRALLARQLDAKSLVQSDRLPVSRQVVAVHRAAANELRLEEIDETLKRGPLTDQHRDELRDERVRLIVQRRRALNDIDLRRRVQQAVVTRVVLELGSMTGPKNVPGRQALRRATDRADRARRALEQSYQPLVDEAVKRESRADASAEDLERAAREGVRHAIDTHDPSPGRPLASHVATCIVRALRDARSAPPDSVAGY